jgi:hypothetical protein
MGLHNTDKPPVDLTHKVLVAVGLAALCLAGCNGQQVDHTAVPDVATGPYACAGVPWAGARLMAGTDDLEVQVNSGRWGAEKIADQLHCSLATPDGAEQSRSVAVRDYGAFAPADVTAEAMRGIEGAQSIRADQPGEGYVWDHDESLVKAGWVCDERHVVVDFFHYGQPVGDRDAHTDVARYLTSMLPWACGNEDVPT